MATHEHDGTFDDGKSYSHKAIARNLGVKDRWVVENMLQKGLHHFSLGRLHMVAGIEIRLWIERNSGPWDDE